MIVLSEGIYDYFDERYGTRQPKPNKHQRKRARQDKALKKIKELPEGTCKKPRRKVFHLKAFNPWQKNSSSWSENTTVWKSHESWWNQKGSTCLPLSFWRFSKQLLDDNSNNKGTRPDFSQEVAHEFFKEVYHAEPRNFAQPVWMLTPTSLSPKTEFDSDEIQENEVSRAIKHSKSSSAASPFDQVSYLIFKRCPALQTALLDLFNTCWSQSVIPTQWKMAAIKLIVKPSAMDKPTSPFSFRPTALTSCIGKLFSTILKNRWIDYMIDNRFLDHSIQVFMSATSGHNPGWDKEKAQVPCSVLARSTKCIW